MGKKQNSNTKLKWYQHKGVVMGLCAGLALATTAAILAPTLVSISKKTLSLLLLILMAEQWLLPLKKLKADSFVLNQL